MDRRVFLLTGLAAAFATSALAQQSGGTATPMPNESGSMNRTGSQMGQAEMQHMQQTMQLGMVALETSRIALTKANNEDLKRFANFEVQEQTTLSEVLRSMMEPAATAATGQSSAQASPMQMDASARDMMQKLQSQQTGAAFDKAYLEGQMQGHRDLLQVQERYLQSNSQNREHMNVARMARAQIREHIALLETMQKIMR